MSILAHVVRIRPAWLRCSLLPIVWVNQFGCYVLRSMLPACIGGHPNKWRLLCADFYAMPLWVFCAAWNGEFVPTLRRGEA